MRIAHLTDLHLRHHLPGSSPIPARLSRRGPELLRKALGQALSAGCDVVAFTGDLVDLPDSYFGQDAPPPESWPWTLARRDYHLVVELLDEAGLPWLVVPGNHDALWLLEEVLAGRDRVLESDGVRLVGFWDEEDGQHVPWRTGSEQALFRAVIDDEGSTVPPIQVHLQHFVITPELNEGYPHTYGDGGRLRDEVVASGRVALALSGHYHPGWQPERIGGCTFAVTPALCEAPHRWRIFDLDPDGSSDDGWSVRWEDRSLEGQEPVREREEGVGQ